MSASSIWSRSATTPCASSSTICTTPASYSWDYLYQLGVEHDRRWRDYLAALAARASAASRSAGEPVLAHEVLKCRRAN